MKPASTRERRGRRKKKRRPHSLEKSPVYCGSGKKREPKEKGHGWRVKLDLRRLFPRPGAKKKVPNAGNKPRAGKENA